MATQLIDNFLRLIRFIGVVFEHAGFEIAAHHVVGQSDHLLALRN